MNCFIMRGLPGSGKSSIANCILPSFICSTDNYWNRPDGTYDFNFRLLSEAHKWNYNTFVNRISWMRIGDGDEDSIIVDNTNLTFKECKPYIDTARLNNFQVYLVEPVTDWMWDIDILEKKNSHNVPRETLVKMKARWEPSETIAMEYFPALKILKGLEDVKQVFRDAQSI